MDHSGLHCGRRYFRNRAEFKRWYEIRSKGFGDWYVSADPGWSLLNNRHVHNCRAALFPDFVHQVRTAEGEAVGYLATAPGYWSGEEQALQNLEYIEETLTFNPIKMLALTLLYLLTFELLRSPALFERLTRGVRASRMAGANAIFLVAIAVDPAYRKYKLPTLLFGAAKAAARRLGYDYVGSPFRPNGYGAFKAARQATHSDALFDEYCRMTTPEGLPVDPWLRNVVRQGARLVRPVPRSLAIKGSLAKFDRVRRSFRPNDWYSPAPDVWECGETCTWYVDRARKLAISVESNCWGIIDLRRDEAANEPFQDRAA